MINKKVRQAELNLYGVDKGGNDLQFTQDHIIPISKGGLNNISNLQILCKKCNVEKKNEAFSKI